MNAVRSTLSWLWKAGTFSPRGFVLRASMVSVLYGISRLLGMQEYTTCLTGTSANPNLSWELTACLGSIHLLLHFAFVLLVPISLMAAALLAAWSRWRTRAGTLQRKPETPKPMADV